MIDKAKIAELRDDVCKWIESNGYTDMVRVYALGDCVDYSNGEKAVLPNMNPKDFFEYGPKPERHILSMSFEGPLYGVFNHYYDGSFKIEADFDKLLKRHGVYRELGNAWNLSCYEIPKRLQK